MAFILRDDPVTLTDLRTSMPVTLDEDLLKKARKKLKRKLKSGKQIITMRLREYVVVMAHREEDTGNQCHEMALRVGAQIRHAWL